VAKSITTQQRKNKGLTGLLFGMLEASVEASVVFVMRTFLD